MKNQQLEKQSIDVSTVHKKPGSDRGRAPAQCYATFWHFEQL